MTSDSIIHVQTSDHDQHTAFLFQRIFVKYLRIIK